MSLQRLHIPFESFMPRSRRRQPRHGAYPVVAIGDEVLHESLGGSRVVDEHRVDVQVHQASVDDDDGDSGFDQPLAGRTAFRGGGDDYARHLFGLHQIDVQLLFFDVLVGIAEKDGMLMAVGHVLDGTCNRCEKRVLNIGDNEAKDLRALHP